MGTRKREEAELLRGLIGTGSGDIVPIEFVRVGVIRARGPAIHVKRPNQYPKPPKKQ